MSVKLWMHFSQIYLFWTSDHCSDFNDICTASWETSTWSEVVVCKFWFLISNYQFFSSLNSDKNFPDVIIQKCNDHCTSMIKVFFLFDSWWVPKNYNLKNQLNMANSSCCFLKYYTNFFFLSALVLKVYHTY